MVERWCGVLRDVGWLFGNVDEENRNEWKLEDAANICLSS